VCNDASPEKPHPTFKAADDRPMAVDGKEIYRFLTTQYLHQNQLSWSRLQTIFAIEAGLLAWFFSAHNTTISIIVVGMVLGSIAIWLLHQLILRDWEVRDQNAHLLDEVHAPLKIRLIKEACRKWLKGQYVAAYLTYGSIIVNLILSLLHLHNVA
jgi:hypothetical protein